MVAVGNETLLFPVSQARRILHKIMAGFWVPWNRDSTHWGPKRNPSLSVSLITQLLHVNLQEIVRVVNRDVNSKKNLYLCYSS